MSRLRSASLIALLGDDDLAAGRQALYPVRGDRPARPFVHRAVEADRPGAARLVQPRDVDDARPASGEDDRAAVEPGALAEEQAHALAEPKLAADAGEPTVGGGETDERPRARACRAGRRSGGRSSRASASAGSASRTTPVGSARRRRRRTRSRESGGSPARAAACRAGTDRSRSARSPRDPTETVSRGPFASCETTWLPSATCRSTAPAPCVPFGRPNGR